MLIFYHLNPSCCHFFLHTQDNNKILSEYQTLESPNTTVTRKESHPKITSALTMLNFKNLSAASFSQTNAEHTAQRRPMFRFACDACRSAKVRCNKSKPECVRCTARGYPCHYSIARRSGKQKTQITRQAFTPVYAVAPSPTQNTAHQNSLLCFSDEYHPLSVTQTNAVEEESKPNLVSNLGPKISASAILECANDESGKQTQWSSNTQTMNASKTAIPATGKYTLSSYSLLFYGEVDIPEGTIR